MWYHGKRETGHGEFSRLRGSQRRSRPPWPCPASSLAVRAGACPPAAPTSSHAATRSMRDMVSSSSASWGAVTQWMHDTGHVSMDSCGQDQGQGASDGAREGGEGGQRSMCRKFRMGWCCLAEPLQRRHAASHKTAQSEPKTRCRPWMPAAPRAPAPTPPPSCKWRGTRCCSSGSRCR